MKLNQVFPFCKNVVFFELLLELSYTPVQDSRLGDAVDELHDRDDVLFSVERLRQFGDLAPVQGRQLLSQMLQEGAAEEAILGGAPVVKEGVS